MNDILFVEKQYLGLNRMSLISRMSLSIFCFIAYYWRSNHQKEGDLYFFIGIGIIIISIILLFILHFVTKVENRSIILEGLWTARKVKIDITSILTSEKITYSKFIFNRAVYNLHRKGRINFYTYGRNAVQLTDKDGLIYIIGSQRADELNKIINNNIQKIS